MVSPVRDEGYEVCLTFASRAAAATQVKAHEKLQQRNCRGDCHAPGPIWTHSSEGNVQSELLSLLPVEHSTPEAVSR